MEIAKQESAKKKANHYAHHKYFFRISLLGKIFSYFVLPGLIIIIALSVINYKYVAFDLSLFLNILKALTFSIYRLFVAYILALAIGISLAILVFKNQKTEEILLPVFDVLESIPVLVFFPIVIIFFIKMGMLNFAAIFIIFLNMLWNIVFSVIGGLKAIPKDIFYVAKTFNITGVKYFTKILLPAIFPVLVTGSILAWAEGWNMLIVAEVLHTYVPSNIQVADLYGIGSILVESSSDGNNLQFALAVSVIVFSIIAINLLCWQKLLKYSEKFKFE